MTARTTPTSFFDTTTNLYLDGILAGKGGWFQRQWQGNNYDKDDDNNNNGDDAVDGAFLVVGGGVDNDALEEGGEKGGRDHYIFM